MQATKIIMGMPITIVIADDEKPDADKKEEIGKIFEYFRYVDEKFSTYKDTSEIMAINRGELPEKDWSDDMRTVLRLSGETKEKTNGYFDIRTPDGSLDPSGLVKGWSIWNAARMLRRDGFRNFYVDAGGDLQPFGKNAEGKPWTVGIRNPFKADEIVKVISLSDEGVATSGTYVRGEHIYNPKEQNRKVFEIVSLTVIGPNVYEADRFATAAFAMGSRGIHFLEKLPGFEAYLIDREGIATMTSNFEKYADQ